MFATTATTSTNPFHTPIDRYFASAADAAFWTKLEVERAKREAEYCRLYEARQAERSA